MDLDLNSLTVREVRDLRDALGFRSTAQLAVALRSLATPGAAGQAEELDLLDAALAFEWVRRRRDEPGLKYEDVDLPLADLGDLGVTSGGKDPTNTTSGSPPSPTSSGGPEPSSTGSPTETSGPAADTSSN